MGWCITSGDVAPGIFRRDNTISYKFKSRNGVEINKVSNTLIYNKC